MASTLLAMASNLLAMASNLNVDGLQPTSEASNLLAMACSLLAMASNLPTLYHISMASNLLARPPTY